MQVRTILLDIGGVVAPDYWEAVWLTPEHGLSARLGIPPETIIPVAKRLWSEFNRAPRSEGEYWSRFSAELGRQLSPSLVGDVEEAVLVPNPYLDPWLESLSTCGVRFGIITNNTSFWFPKQVARTRLMEFAQPSLSFYSFREGTIKRDGSPDLFAVAAMSVNPLQTLIVDDSPKNCKFASTLGFRTLHYDSTAYRTTGEPIESYPAPRFTPFPTLDQLDSLTGL